MGERVSLLVVEDNRLLGEGIAAALRKHPDVQVMAIARSSDAALTELQKTEPQLVLLDAAVADGKGTDLGAAPWGTCQRDHVIGLAAPAARAGLVNTSESWSTGSIVRVT